MTSSNVSIQPGGASPAQEWKIQDDADTVQVWKVREDGTLGTPLTLDSDNLRALCACKARFVNANPVQELERLTECLAELGAELSNKFGLWSQLHRCSNDLTKLLHCHQIAPLFNEALADCRQAADSQQPIHEIIQSSLGSPQMQEDSDDEDCYSLISHVAAVILQPLASRLHSPDFQKKVRQQLQASALYEADDSCLSNEMATAIVNLVYWKIYQQVVTKMETVDLTAQISYDDIYSAVSQVRESSVLAQAMKFIQCTPQVQLQFLKGPQICLAFLQGVIRKSPPGSEAGEMTEERALEVFSAVWATIHEIGFKFHRHQTADWSGGEKAYAAAAFNTFFSQPWSIDQMATSLENWAGYRRSVKIQAHIDDFKVLAQSFDRLDELLDPDLALALQARMLNTEQPATTAIFKDMVQRLEELQLAFEE